MSHESVEIYPYKFKVVMVEHPQEQVYLAVTRTEANSEIGKTDRPKMKEIFDDLGKWEALTTVGSMILKEIQGGSPILASLRPYSSDRYEFVEDDRPDRYEPKIGYFVMLTSSERK